MKKLLIVFAAGALLTSCGSSFEDKEAAAGFCECYNMQAEAAESASFTDMMEGVQKMGECTKAWQEKYKGKISEDGFSKELKEVCPDAHDSAKKMGVLK